jgi:ribose transport system substrate-binding protein
MHPVAKVATVLLLAGVLVFCISACGSSSTPTSSSSAETSTSSGTGEGGAETASATSGGNAQSRTVNLGAGPVKVGGEPLKIAFLTATSNNAFQQSYNQAAEEEAKTLGVELTLLDAGFEPLKQVNQAQTALAQHQYNAWSIQGLSPQICNIVKEAASKGIIVSAVNQQICKSFDTEGDAAWQPGTVNFIAGDQAPKVFSEWLMKVAEDNPGKQKIILVEGLNALAQTQFANQAAEEVEAKYPEVSFVKVNVETYNLEGAEEEVEAVLPANKDATILASDYSEMTQGAKLVLNAAGRDDIKVYDMGGNKWAFEAIENGEIELTSMFLPATAARESIKSLYDTWYKGEPGPHSLDVLDELSTPFVTKENIDKFEPQY